MKNNIQHDNPFIDFFKKPESKKTEEEKALEFEIWGKNENKKN